MPFKNSAFLLRVGIDTEIGEHREALSPIFEDDTFEFIPLPPGSPPAILPKYSDIIGTTRKPLSDYLPTQFKNRRVHVDPGFPHFSKWTMPWHYDDFREDKPFLEELKDGGYLFFYAGFIRQNESKEQLLGIFSVFKVNRALFGDNLKKAVTEDPELRRLAGFQLVRENINKAIDVSRMIVIEADPSESSLLKKAAKISEKKPDQTGRPCHVLSKKWAAIFGIEQKSIQRSICPIRVNVDRVPMALEELSKCK
jgi:hypothetical protein